MKENGEKEKTIKNLPWRPGSKIFLRLKGDWWIFYILFFVVGKVCAFFLYPKPLPFVEGPEAFVLLTRLFAFLMILS